MPLNVGGDIINTNSFGNTSLINNVVTNGLTCYLDASDKNSYPGSGSSWFDMSGFGLHATWNSPSWVDGGAASYFNTFGRMCRGYGSNRYGIDNSSGYSIIWVSQTNSGTANAAFKFVNSNANIGRGIFVHPGWFNNTIYFDQGGCCDPNQRTDRTFTAADFTNWRMWAVVSTVSERRIYMNGVMYARNTTAAANINLDSTQVYIGGDDTYSSATSSNWDGRLSMFMVYNRGLTAAEIYQNYFVQKNKFSI